MMAAYGRHAAFADGHGGTVVAPVASRRRELLAEGAAKGRAEGERLGQMKAVEGLLRVGVGWDVIEEATGLNETGFKALKERLSASNDPTPPQSR